MLETFCPLNALDRVWLKVVDHIDNNPKNNRLENLRWATRTFNNLNRNVSDRSKKNFVKGYEKIEGKFRVRICQSGNTHIFNTFENEADAYKNAKEVRAQLLIELSKLGHTLYPVIPVCDS